MDSGLCLVISELNENKLFCKTNVFILTKKQLLRNLTLPIELIHFSYQFACASHISAYKNTTEFVKSYLIHAVCQEKHNQVLLTKITVINFIMHRYK